MLIISTVLSVITGGGELFDKLGWYRHEVLSFRNDVPIWKGYDWIRLVFAHLFPCIDVCEIPTRVHLLNSGAPIASANFISGGKVQVDLIHTLPEKAL